MTNREFRQFICRACGLVYDEARGDPDSGLPPGTRFEDIPEDWSCPLCGVTKADFDPMIDARTASGSPMSPAATAATARASGQAWSARSGRTRVPAGLVIVGGGTAGWALVEAVRERDASLPITLVSACDADRYDKPRLSVAMHQGLDPAALPRERGVDAARRLGVRLLSRTHAAGVDPVGRRLRTSRGTVRFDDLALAYGAATRSCAGMPDAHTWRINDLATYRGLRQALQALPEPRCPETVDVAIVGAGLVGCELANDLALAGHSVVLLEAADRPLPMASPQQSEALLQAWDALPLRFLGGVHLRAVDRAAPGPGESAAADQTRPWTLRTAQGMEVQAHLLVSAVGLSTPARLAKQAGLQWNEGIAVDPLTLSTGVAHLHALGDCISLEGRPQRFIEPIYRQARLIADRICGLPVDAYDARCPIVRVKTGSLPFTMAA